MSDAHRGDTGKTFLSSPTPIGKDDIRLEAIGTVEELLAVLRLSALEGLGPSCPTLASITDTLESLIAYVHSGGKAVHLPKPEAIALLEERIAALSGQHPKTGVGLTEESARTHHAAAVCRRAERALVHAARVYSMKESALAYINRLGEFLTVLASYTDAKALRVEESSPAPSQKVNAAKREADDTLQIEEAVRSALREVGAATRLTLGEAKRLIEEVEVYAKKTGKSVVVAVVDAGGNPIAVHVMDGAYLVSFDVAVKKAYTAVSVRMPTVKLGPLVAPGGTFQGLHLVDSRIVTFGGGIPLYRGGVLVGGLGISGGTGDEDHALCEYAERIFGKL